MGNVRYPVVLFLTSFVMLMVGLIFKIQHWAGAQLIIGSMWMVQIVSIIWLIMLLVRKR